MIIRSTLLLMVSVTFVIAEESLVGNVFSDKRGSMGFQGMRGKKNFLSLDSDDFEFLKRAPMGFQVIVPSENN